MINFYNQQNRDNYVDSHGAGSAAPAKSVKTPKPSAVKYEDPTGEFSAGQFKWGIWFVKNKVVLYRLSVASLIAFCAITVGFSLWKGVEILVFDLTAKPQMEKQLTASLNYAALQAHFNPAPLEILNSYVLPGGTDRVDALAEVANPNNRHVAIIDFHFDFGNTTTPVQTAVVMPLESRPIIMFGLDTVEYAGSADLVIDRINWKRISAHTVPDVESWQNERLTFTIDDFVFGYAGTAGEPNAHSLRFKLKNGTPYGYKNPLFYIGLYQSGALVGVMKFDLVDFQSLESRDIDLRNFVQNLSVSEIKLYPVIDLYNNEVYLPPKRI